jgi:Flp pilus assembly protein TadB
MIALPLVGAAIGALLFWLFVQVRPPRPDPLVELGRFHLARGAMVGKPVQVGRAAGLQSRVGRWFALELARRGLAYTTLRQDLALSGQDFDAAIGRKVLVGVGGFMFGLMLMTLMSIAGVGLPLGTPLVVALGLGALFFFVPDLESRQGATKRRREFRRALGAYLDWVSLQMSGRAAAEQALPDATRIGGGWPLALIRHTVNGATRSGQDVWDALGELGHRIGVAQLAELGALVQLVSHDGAQVRDTLSARAASLRAEELADAQGVAGKRDQSMLMAQILLGVGFAVFLGYPAIVNFLRI